MEVRLPLEAEQRLHTLLSTLSNDMNHAESLNALMQLALDQSLPAEEVPGLLSQRFDHPALDQLLNNLGLTFWNSMQYDYVIPLMQQALTLNPANQDALYNIGYVLYAYGESALSLSYLRSIENKSEEVSSLILEINRNLRPTFFDEFNVKEFQLADVPHKIYARMDTSDPYVLNDIFQRREYQLPELSFAPRFIIDCGANSGYASIWFANVYPRARIIAIEPEKSNFEILEYNIRSYPQIQSIQSGIWNKNTNLEIRDVGRGKWGMMVTELDEPTATSFKAVTIQSILEQSGFDEIDILKIDIEGAEKEVFASGYENWLGKVKVLIIELHDRMKRGSSKSFFKAISLYDFAFSMQGENLIFIREDRGVI